MNRRRDWGTLAIGMRAGENIHTATVASLVTTAVAGLRPGDVMLSLTYRSYHHVAANELIRMFLERTRADSLLMIDSDQTWQPGHIAELRDNKHGRAYDVLGGLYVDRIKGTPHAYRFSHYHEDEPGRPMYEKLATIEPEGHVLDVDALGFGFTMIRRELLERMSYPWAYFRTPDTGEDITFCHDARTMHDAAIGLHSGVQVGHLATRDVGWSDFRAQWAEAQARKGAR